MDAQTRILVADDHPIVRQGLKQILADHTGMVVSGEAATGPEALEKAATDSFDVVILDISMPGMGGLDVLRRLKEERPKLPVIVMSVHPEDQYASRVLSMGASGFLNKESAPRELPKAIAKALAGKTYVSSDLAESLAAGLGNDTGKQLHDNLTEREYNVMLMLASGQSLAEIAKDLFLSVKTVSTYRTRALQKMSMRSNAEWITYAMRERLVQ